MKRPVLSRTRCRASDAQSSGYTLVEILVATTLSLILLGAVVRMFGDVSQSITDSRAMLEASDRLRITATRLQQDLAGVTATMNPPRRPENNEGYFEYIEGPVGPQVAPPTIAANTQVTSNVPDTTVGDFDDILMFTTRSTGRPFVGRFNTGTITSDVAEVAWFVRGRTLYRRILLVVPNAAVPTNPIGVYANYDVSVHAISDPNDATGTNKLCVPNTLGDLTRRECRFAHKPWFTLPASPPNNWPYDSRIWGQLGLPTLRECSDPTYNLAAPPAVPTDKTSIDFWANKTSLVSTDAFPWADNVLLPNGTRIADDVILTNVIAFDVKAWDPGAPVLFDSSQNRTILPGDPGYVLPVSGTLSIVGYGAYVDLGYYPTYVPLPSAPVVPRFHTLGNSHSGLLATAPRFTRVYDTYSTHYESVGQYSGDPLAGRSTNGFDDVGYSGTTNGLVDDADELVTSPPYPYPLRGIQVKIRVFEPDSRQILEWTVVQDFLPR
jgi:type II secretory pathway component PulJ